jgi:hypothetical protein
MEKFMLGLQGHILLLLNSLLVVKHKEGSKIWRDGSLGFRSTWCPYALQEMLTINQMILKEGQVHIKTIIHVKR